MLPSFKLSKGQVNNFLKDLNGHIAWLILVLTILDFFLMTMGFREDERKKQGGK